MGGKLLQRRVKGEVGAAALFRELDYKPAEIYKALGKAQLNAAGSGLQVAGVRNVVPAQEHSRALRLRHGGEAGTEQPVVSISLANGSDGSVASLSPADFIGTDNGAGQRTGIQAFLDRESSCCISPFTPEMA